MPVIELETGIRMHYRDGGHGRPVLFIPGLAATLDTWNYQVHALHDRFRCICVDMRGHGDSDKPYTGYAYDDFCGDIGALLTALDLDDVALVGWSMGAGVALKYVARRNQDKRVTGLAMLAPATPYFLATESEPFGMAANTAQATLEGMRVALPETMAAFASANFHRDGMQATAEWFLSLWLKMPAYAGCQCFQTLLDEDLRDLLGTIRMPTLICHGIHDLVAHPGWSDYIVERIDDARLVRFEDSGHALMVEEPDRLSRELSAFLSAS